MQRTTATVMIPFALLGLALSPLFSDEHDKKTDITIDQTVQVPGATLQPGKYMFILLNSSSNRNIVEIKSPDQKTLYAMILTTRAARVDRTGKTVFTFYEMPQGAPPAVRQWFWPGDFDGQEFLYRHGEASRISQATSENVPEATDQEYAALKDADGATITATSNDAVTSNDAAVAATTADVNSNADQVATAAPAPAQPVADQSSQVDLSAQAANQPNDTTQADQSSQKDVAVAQANAPVDDRPSNDTLAQNTPPASTNVAPSADPNASQNSNDESSLPQTASPAPLIGLMGFSLLAAWAGLRIAHRSV